MTVAGALDAVVAALVAIRRPSGLRWRSRSPTCCSPCARTRGAGLCHRELRDLPRALRAGGLVMQSALAVFYVGMGAYGWWVWRRGIGAAGDALPVSRWSARQHASGRRPAAGRVAREWLARRALAGGVVPYVDALVAWVSVLATWMVAAQGAGELLYWIVIDAVAALLYWSQGSTPPQCCSWCT